MDLADRITDLMPRARSELADLVSIRSVADPRQFPPEECARAAQWVLDAFKELGFADVGLHETADGSKAVVGSRPCGDPDAHDRAALRALRRPAPAGRRRVADAAVRADRGRRPVVRARRSRLQGQHPDAPHRPAGDGRRRTGQPQAGRRGLGGAGHRRAGGLRAEERRPAPRRRDPRVRHGQRRRRRARRDREPARHGQRRRARGGAHHRGALGHVRRTGPGRTRRSRGRCSPRSATPTATPRSPASTTPRPGPVRPTTRTRSARDAGLDRRRVAARRPAPSPTCCGRVRRSPSSASTARRWSARRPRSCRGPPPG